MAPRPRGDRGARRRPARVRLEWLPIALRDRDSQIAYIAERNPWAAIDIGDTIEVAVGRLIDYPHSGRPGRIAGTRELIIGGTPFVIAYRVETGAVVILRLLHGAQQWPSRL
jgi:toxin ParE1/3/4